MFTKTLERAFLTAVLCINGLGASPATISVDEIVDRHIQALGGQQKLDSLQTVITRGEYREGTFFIPGAFIARMRPFYKTICDQRKRVSDVCEGYDGSAW